MGFQSTFNDRVIPAGDRAFGIEITLAHGVDVTEAFTAQWDRRTYQIADEEGFITSHEVRDFTFAVADVTNGSDLITPRAGDRIALTENGRAVEYEILPLATMPAVELMDGGYRWKAHTKRVA